jgi:tRNA pseudouridine32 synthase/23S rRNA pseudouridine746 synthase/23S rRNA pseudouridine1911/1915/1917 synthase
MSEKYKKISHKSSDKLAYIIEKEMQLLPFLIEVLSQRSRNSVKSILGRGQVTVDDYIVTQFNYLLHPGQTVEILKNKAAIRENNLIGLKIQYEDNDLIIVEKEAGLLSIASEKEKELTAHYQLMNYVRNKGPMNRVFVVHRLDKDTSGVMMFAKNERSKQVLQTAWRDMVKERTYFALVLGNVQQDKGTIKSWLRESKTRTVYSSYTKGDGLTAVTHYKKIQSNENYSLLEVELETGRKNQIRVHMKDIGHPVVGDKKYGSTTNMIGRLGLHAKVLAFHHPTTKKYMRFEAEVPASFYNKSK